MTRAAAVTACRHPKTRTKSASRRTFEWRRQYCATVCTLRPHTLSGESFLMRDIGSTKLIGGSKAMVALRAEIARIGQSNARVLITGESGAGKEVVARAIYEANERPGQPFAPVNCAGIPAT